LVPSLEHVEYLDDDDDDDEADLLIVYV